MTRKYSLIYLLLCFCGSLLSFISSARAQNGCTPVVYVFRHAEDEKEAQPEHPCLDGSPVKCTTALTPLGMKHACLYRDEMMPIFEANHANYCHVEYVLAVDPVKPNNSGGTTNPYLTGAPFSVAVTHGSDPIVTIEVKGVNRNIDELLTNVKPEDLRAYLHSILTPGGNPPQPKTSAAIFWTSDGLRDLGKALSGDIAGKVIPKKNKALGVPPRNAAYIFIDNGGDFFDPPPKP